MYGPSARVGYSRGSGVFEASGQVIKLEKVLGIAQSRVSIGDCVREKVL